MIWDSILICFYLAPIGGDLHNEIADLINTNNVSNERQIKIATKIVEEKCNGFK